MSGVRVCMAGAHGYLFWIVVSCKHTSYNCKLVIGECLVLGSWVIWCESSFAFDAYASTPLQSAPSPLILSHGYSAASILLLLTPYYSAA